MLSKNPNPNTNKNVTISDPQIITVTSMKEQQIIKFEETNKSFW